MVDKNTIIEKYASMPDSELVAFAKNEGYQLTEENKSILKTEFISRRLDYDALMTGNDNYLIDINIGDNKNTNPHLAYALDQMEYGKVQHEITAGLLEMGLDENEIAIVLFKVSHVCKQRIKKAEHDRLLGSAILISGIAITFLPLSMPQNRLTYILAWGAIILGFLRLIKGIYNKSRFEKIRRNHWRSDINQQSTYLI